MTLKNEHIPHLAIHPGNRLLEELLVRGIKQNKFAKETGILPSHLNEILKGKRPITPKMALAIGDVLAIEAELWINLQATYNLDLARIEKTTQVRLESI